MSMSSKYNYIINLLKSQAGTLQIILHFLPGFLCANKLISRQISNNGVKKSEKSPKISCLICTKHGRLFVVKKRQKFTII